MSWSDVVNNLAATWSQITNSYISTGAGMLSAENSNYTMNTNYDSLFTFLKDYPFLVGIRDLIVSTIKEAIATTDFAVTTTNPAREKEIEGYNKRLKEMGFKNRLIDHLDEIVYRGSYLFGLDPKEDRIIEVETPYAMKVIRKRNTIVGYLYNDKYIPNKNAIGYWYKIDHVEHLELKDAKKQGIKLGKAEPKEVLTPFEIGLTVFTGKSVFKSLMDKFYQAYIQEYMLYQLGLRETIRPEILSMVISGSRTNITQASKAADNIERLLNQSAAALTSAVDPINFINQVTFFLLNNIKVVPQVDSFSSLSDIGVDDFSDKRRQLADELKDNKDSILNIIGIPDELFSGSSNKWEVMSRNDRYATVSNTHLQAIADTNKRAVIALAARDGKALSEDELVFNLEVSSFLSSYESRTKITNLADRLRELQGLLDSINAIKDQPLVDKNIFKEYLNKQLGLLDADLANMINMQELTNPNTTMNPGFGGVAPQNNGLIY